MKHPPPPAVPEVAIVNARVFTGDVRRPWADAVLVGGGRIRAIGSSAEIRKRAGGSAHVVDARRQMLVRAPEGASGSGTELWTEPLGTLAVGTSADMVLLDTDVPTGSVAGRGEARVVLKMAGGHITLDRDGLTR